MHVDEYDELAEDPMASIAKRSYQWYTKLLREFYWEPLKKVILELINT